MNHLTSSPAADLRHLPYAFLVSGEVDRVLLRDGSSAQIRIARPDDLLLMEDFFSRLSIESRRHRFGTAGAPRKDFARDFCDDSDPSKRLTLIAVRRPGGTEKILGTGTYVVTPDGSAEVAFAVDDALQGQGLGSLLLERLALRAAGRGVTRFQALTHADNRAMIEVFHRSGFTLREKRDGSTVELDFALAPTEASVHRSELIDHVFTVASLRPFFRPNAIAVIGASRDASSVGGQILHALVSGRFEGPVYPVNPKAKVVESIRAYPTIGDVPERVDLAVVAVPATAVGKVVDECGAAGVRALVVVSAGFAEVNPAGRKAQDEVLQKVRGHGMRMVGPNCLGILNTDPEVRANASFSSVFGPPGKVAMASQSGALGLAILRLAGHRGLALSTFVSLGNKADVSTNDLLQYWEVDPHTDVILMYLESFGNPRRFARLARRVGRTKPIVAVKGGRTKVGRRAAGSHTAALAADETAVEALFHQTGIIQTSTLEDMFDVAALLRHQPLPPGRRVGLVTNAGGPAILCADACEDAGLVVPELDAATRERLATFLPPAASTGNPVDLIASATPEAYRKSVEVLLASGSLDALIAIYIPVVPTDFAAYTRAIAEGVAAARKAGTTGKPVLACLLHEDSAKASIDAGSERVPVYSFPENVGRALARAASYAEWRARPLGVHPDFPDIDPAAARRVCREALRASGSGWLSAGEIREVLSALGLPVLPGGIATTEAEAVDLARRAGFPVAMKIASRRIVHKTEVGGVRLHLGDEAAVRAAWREIHARLEEAGRLGDLEGVLVQPMVEGGVELMIGATTDPSFGPLVAFGLGGIHVEILGDVKFRVTPLTDLDASEMVRSIRGWRLLEGYRGHPPADVASVEQVLLRVSRLLEEVPEITELDLNPVMALGAPEGCRIVDARIRVG